MRLYSRSDGCVGVSNIEPERTHPDWLDVEVLSSELLVLLSAEIDDVADREHVTAAIRRDPERFPRAALVAGDDLGDLCWTVDTSEDLDFVREVVTRLAGRHYAAGLSDILRAVRTSVHSAL